MGLSLVPGLEPLVARSLPRLRPRSRRGVTMRGTSRYFVPDPCVPTEPMRRLIESKGLSHRTAGHFLAARYGYLPKSGERMLERWLAGPTLSIYAADRICTLFDLHLVNVYGVEALMGAAS